MSESANLGELAKVFALDVSTRILMCLEGEPQSDELKVDESPDAERCTFVYEQGVHAQKQNLPRVGTVRFNFSVTLDRSRRHLAVHKSSFQLLESRGKKPIIRMEYVRDSWRAPCSHIQIHAESGLFTHLLARTGHKSPAAIESIHLPTGGDRFRPCIEDFVEFLIRDCMVAGRDGWEAEVKAGREDWRRMQTAAAVRDRPEVAIAELTRLGLTVIGDLAPERPSARDRY
ncbi:hypothetical protein ACW2Q0_11060 [Nocardia sp. R16R-3T]